jgi:hypothetical protein
MSEQSDAVAQPSRVRRRTITASQEVAWLGAIPRPRSYAVRRARWGSAESGVRRCGNAIFLAAIKG